MKKPTHAVGIVLAGPENSEVTVVIEDKEVVLDISFNGRQAASLRMSPVQAAALSGLVRLAMGEASEMVKAERFNRAMAGDLGG